MNAKRASVTQLLADWRAGDASAPPVERDLHFARARLRARFAA
jgi:hypothetical protein